MLKSIVKPEYIGYSDPNYIKDLIDKHSGLIDKYNYLINNKDLFNPEGNDSLDNKILGSNITNIIDTYNVKYKWATSIWDLMVANFWIPQKYSMIRDISSYEELTDEEKEAYLKIISFLIYLDSLQTNNLPNISDYITSAEVVLCLANQTFQEANHSLSYSYILTSIFDKETANKALYYWRDNKVLLKRNKFIASIYQDFVDNKSIFNYLRVIVANYLLEGLYFYNGFNFFYNLNSRSKMMNTGTQIKYINRDEKTHCVLFSNILNTIMKEFPELKDIITDLCYTMFIAAVEQEIEFSYDAIGDNILGMSKASIKEYTCWLANSRLHDIGLESIFNAPEVNPYKHLERIASIENEDSVKGNNFETQTLNYKQASILDGWDEI